MRFNSAELAALCTNPTTKFEREGLLVLTERHEGFFRRTDVNCLHWCKLYGNLLFYLKDHDPHSQIAGVIVLENVRPVIRNEEREFDGFVFFLEFEGSLSQRLAARTAQERQQWLQSLKNASCSYLDRQISLLKEQIAIRMGNNIETGTRTDVHDNETMSMDPNSSAGAASDNQITSFSNIEEDLSEIPICECALSCERLLTSNQRNRVLNYRIVVSAAAALTHSNVLQWRDYACTEIVEGTINPKFLCTIRFRRSDGFNSDSSLRFTIYDVREKVSSASVPLGYVEVTLGEIQDVTQFRMPIRSLSGQCGFLIVSCLRPDTQELTFKTRSSVQFSKSPRKGHRRVQSLPSKLGVNHNVPSHKQLQKLFANPQTQTYQMCSISGGDIRVLECLLESKLCFTLPQQLLSIWILREKELLQEISGMGELGGEWRRRQMDLLDKHLKMLNDYSQAQQNLQQIYQETGSYFKRSTLKMDEALEFVPVNLHLQRMKVYNGTLSKKSLLDITTVGAFARHSVATRTGGLKKLLQTHKTPPSKYKENNSCKVKATNDVVQTVKELRKEIVDIMVELLYLAKIQNPTDMMPLCNEMVLKTKKLLNIWDPNLVAETFAFVEEHRVIEEPDNTITTISPFRKLTQQLNALDLQSPELEGFATPSLAPPDLWPRTKSNLNAELKNLKESNDIGLRYAYSQSALGENYSLKNLDKYWKDDSHIQSEDFGISQKIQPQSATKSDSNGVLITDSEEATNVIEVDIADATRMTDINGTQDPSQIASDRDLDSFKINLNTNETFSRFSQNISFLDTNTMNISPSANYYRPREEPEPLDLTQLNIEASVMCLVSKIKFLCGRCGSPAIRLRYPKYSNKFDGFQNTLHFDVTAEPSMTKCNKYPSIEKSDEKSCKIYENFASIQPECSEVENQNKCINNDQQEFSKKVNKFTEGLDLSQTLDWASELRPSMRKLRQAMDGLLKTARLMHSVQRLQHNTKRTAIDLDIMYRRDVCFSQALTALVSSLMAKLWGSDVTESYISILLEVGPLAYFEGLLSMYGSETDMWGDMCIAIEDLSDINFTLIRNDLKTPPTPYITGSRGSIAVRIPVPENLSSRILTTSNPTFKITPIFFNIGINEKATLAETLGYTRDQNRSNWNNFVRLRHYYTRLWKFQKLNSSTLHQDLKLSTLELVGKIVENMEDQLRANAPKNVKILHLAEDACRHLDGLRFTSCKSAKDRTGMAVTLEQSRVLLQEFYLPSKSLQTVLSAMRSQGTRMQNVYKNINKRRYAFNLPQVMALPALYRPPVGTYGKAET